MTALGPTVIREKLRPLLALRHTEPQELAALLTPKQVKRGMRWLNRNAKLGWHRNCFDSRPDGRSDFRGMNVMDKDCVLALAFEHDKRFANQFGYVTFGMVVNYFKIGDAFARMGFCMRRFPKRNPDVVITSEMLDRVWETMLRDAPVWMWASYRHRTALDKRFAEMDFEFEEPSFLDRFFNRIRLAFSYP